MQVKLMANKKVLFLLPYPLYRAPSQRFRVEAYFKILEKEGIEFSTDTFLDEAAWEVLYQKGSSVQKAWAVIKGFLKRLKTVLFLAPRYNYVFVHREASPIGPPVFEFILSKLLRKKMIYDFDDAIWIPNTSQENKIVSWVKAFWKIKFICKWAYVVAGGNNYLCNYASQFNQNVQLLPTCVDVVNKHNLLATQNNEKVVIGWTGSHSTMIYLNDILPVLQKISADFVVEFLIISNKPPTFQLSNLKFIKWQETTEVQDLAQINIGIMPLKDDAWSEGKCGFKLIQYLSLGIPAVASPVGVNKNIIVEGENGFLCNDDQEWHEALTILIEDETMRKEMGRRGREKIIKEYSIQANAGVFLGLFN